MKNFRLKNVRDAMKKADFDALVLVDVSNVRYLTGFTGHDSWAVVTSRQLYLVTDSRYSEQAVKQCIGTKVIERKGSIVDAAVDILNSTKSIKNVAIEDKTSVNIYSLMRKKLAYKLKTTTSIVENVRQIKDEQEVKAIIKAGKIAISALKNTLSTVEPGISESEFAAKLDYNIKISNSSPGFETIVAFGAGASQPHYQPGKRKLRQNDTILIDFGAVFNGYTCDITRCFTIGRATKQYIQAYQAVVAAQQAAIKMVSPGVKVTDVENAAREIIEKSGFPQYGHGTGHGLGLDVHELPTISNRLTNGELRPGQTITIEPGIYIAGKLGIRIEDDVLVTETGYKLLTPSDLKKLRTPPSVK